MILLAGEITSRAAIDYQKVVRETIKHVGYDDSSKGAFNELALLSSFFQIFSSALSSSVF